MYRTTINFHKCLERGEKPITYVLIQTALGYRVYAKKEIDKVFDPEAGHYADGTYSADGSITAGSGGGVIEKSARVLSFGSFERTISPKHDGLSVRYTSKQQQHISVVLNNADRHFSKILGKEPFLGGAMSLYTGFGSLDFYEHLERFEGVISEVKITSGRMVLEAEEQ